MGKLFLEHVNTQPKPSWVKGRIYEFTDASRVELVRSKGLIQFNHMPLLQRNHFAENHRSLDLISRASYTLITLIVAAWIVSGAYITARILFGF